MPVHVERLEDDRRAGLPLGEDARNVGGARERRAPRDVVACTSPTIELAALLHQPERRVANRGRADEPLDVGLGEQVVEATRLVPRDDERPPLPVLGEERLASTGSRQRASAASAAPTAASVSSASRRRVRVVGVASCRVVRVVASPSVVSVSSPSASAVQLELVAAGVEGLDLVVAQGRHRFLLGLVSGQRYIVRAYTRKQSGANAR